MFAPDFKVVDAEMRAKTPRSDWPGYYAEWFISHRNPRP